MYKGLELIEKDYIPGTPVVGMATAQKQEARSKVRKVNKAGKGEDTGMLL